ncbi:MAG: DUF6478 family protein [Pseudomonadota bacterium]
MIRILDALMHQTALRGWTRAARRADIIDLDALVRLRSRARRMHARINKVLHVAEARLTLPAIGTNAIQKPLHTDWAYRPDLWRGPLQPPGKVAVESKTEFGSELKVFHDCRVSELTLRQVRNARESDLAPFGLRVDVFKFDGSFLSIVLELPYDASKDLERRHVIRLDTTIDAERPLDVFARLNIKNGPNVEQIVRELPREGNGETAVEFDLAYTKLNEKRIEKMWLDLIFEGAEMNQFLLRDVTLTRRPRSEM